MSNTNTFKNQRRKGTNKQKSLIKKRFKKKKKKKKNTIDVALSDPILAGNLILMQIFDNKANKQKRQMVCDKKNGQSKYFFYYFK